MPRIVTSLFILFLTTQVYSQSMTQEEGYRLADELYRTKILSEKGRELLKERIQLDELERERRPSLAGGSIEVLTGVSPAHILVFLSSAFVTDLMYRSGVLEEQRLIQEYIDSYGYPETEQDELLIYSKVDSALKDFDGYAIEEAIEYENPQQDSAVFNLPLYNFYGFEEYDLIHHERSVLGKTVRSTLDDLLQIGLVDSAVFAEVKNNMEKEQFVFEFQVTEMVAERVIFYEDIELNRSRENEFVRQLNTVEVISDEMLSKYFSKEDRPAEFRKFDLLKYCKNARVFRLENYSTNPSTGYAQIFEEIAELVPQFNFSNFNAWIDTELDDGFNPLFEQRLNISFDVGDLSYFNESFYDFKRDTTIRDTLLQVSTKFHQAVNKFLADQDSPYRLYYANDSRPGKFYGDEIFGLILLTKDQFEAWGRGTYFLFEQSHDNTFNTHNIDRLTAVYDSLGLFAHLSRDEIDAGKSCVVSSTINTYQDILLCFPKTIVYFDWETGNLKNPYEQITREVAEASRGQFDPTYIIDDFESSWKKETTYFSFQFNGSTYENHLKMQSDWLDPVFLEMIEEALEKNEIDGELYYCLDNGQATGFIFLSEAQHNYLQENQASLFPQW